MTWYAGWTMCNEAINFFNVKHWRISTSLTFSSASVVTASTSVCKKRKAGTITRRCFSNNGSCPQNGSRQFELWCSAIPVRSTMEQPHATAGRSHIQCTDSVMTLPDIPGRYAWLRSINTISSVILWSHHVVLAAGSYTIWSPKFVT